MRRQYSDHLTYWECERMFREDKRRRVSTRIKLTHNTYLEKRDTGESCRYEVWLHGNLILEFLPEGECVFYTRGWKTATTKGRMNMYGPPGTNVSQRKRVWYLTDRYGERELDSTLTTRPIAEEVAFWQAIAANPADKLHRLMYSDWLLEHGDNYGAWQQRGLAGQSYEERACIYAGT